MMWAVLATPTPTDIATLHSRDRDCKMFVGSAQDQDMPKGNDPTTQLHVKLARLDPASTATLLMATLLLQSLFKRTTSR